MNKFSRADLDQLRRDRKLTKLWNQGLRVSHIAPLLGFNHGSSVSHAAMRLGLAPRSKPRKIRVPVKLAKELAVVQRVDQFLANEKPPALDAIWFRCPHCQGRATHIEGHSVCRGRAA